jgi:colanic acid biosynthesis glycosyl transferase WcaI
MRILLINQTYHPDVVATAQHAHDLARHLAAHGHTVQVIASRSIYGQKGASLPARETVEGVEVHRVGRSLFGKAGILARVMDFGLFYIAATIKAFTLPRPDVVICFTTPPFIALLGLTLARLRQCAFVYWVMDLYPDLPVACGVMRPQAAMTQTFEIINRFCLRKADRVVVLGRCMMDRVLAKGTPGGGDHLVHIGVWADQTEVKPIPREENPYRTEWTLSDRFVVMYSGNFGLGHDVDTMCAAAERLRNDEKIRFVFAGGGKKKSIVDNFVRTHGLANCVVTGYQPREKLDASLSCADVHLASLLEGVEGIMVPCKLFGGMAAARPTIFIGHPSSELARILTEHQCGLVVRQGDVDGLVKAIRGLANNPKTCQDMGARARAALIKHFTREKACEQWREMLEGLETLKHRHAETPKEVAESHT